MKSRVAATGILAYVCGDSRRFGFGGPIAFQRAHPAGALEQGTLRHAHPETPQGATKGCTLLQAGSLTGDDLALDPAREGQALRVDGALDPCLGANDEEAHGLDWADDLAENRSLAPKVDPPFESGALGHQHAFRQLARTRGGLHQSFPMRSDRIRSKSSGSK